MALSDFWQRLFGGGPQYYTGLGWNQMQGFPGTGNELYKILAGMEGPPPMGDLSAGAPVGMTGMAFDPSSGNAIAPDQFNPVSLYGPGTTWPGGGYMQPAQGFDPSAIQVDPGMGGGTVTPDQLVNPPSSLFDPQNLNPLLNWGPDPGSIGSMGQNLTFGQEAVSPTYDPWAQPSPASVGFTGDTGGGGGGGGGGELPPDLNFAGPTPNYPYTPPGVPTGLQPGWPNNQFPLPTGGAPTQPNPNYVSIDVLANPPSGIIYPGQQPQQPQQPTNIDPNAVNADPFAPPSRPLPPGYNTNAEIPGVNLSPTDRVNMFLNNLGLPPLPAGYSPFGGLPPGMTETNRFGGGAPNFPYINPSLNVGPQFGPGGSIFEGGPNLNPDIYSANNPYGYGQVGMSTVPAPGGGGPAPLYQGGGTPNVWQIAMGVRPGLLPFQQASPNYLQRRSAYEQDPNLYVRTLINAMNRNFAAHNPPDFVPGGGAQVHVGSGTKAA